MTLAPVFAQQTARDRTEQRGALVRKFVRLKRDLQRDLSALLTSIVAGDKETLPEGAEDGTHGPFFQALASIERELEQAREAQEMLAAAPIRIIACDPRDLRIIHVNDKTAQTLRTIAHVTSVPVEHLLGRRIDEVFAPLKEHRDRIADARNFPYEAITKTGEDRIEFIFTATFDRQGRHRATLATWSVLSERVNRIRENAEQMDRVAHVAGEVDVIANSMKTAVDRAANRSNAIAASAEEVTVNVKTVANAAEELAQSIEEISRKVEQSTDIA